MKTCLFFALCILAVPAVAQTARVIPLSSRDSQEARAKWEALQAAEKTWADFQEKIQKQYIEVRSDDPDAGNVLLLADVGTLYLSSPDLACFGAEREKNKKPCDERDEARQKAWHDQRSYRKGFEWGFEFDKDFRFLVPKQLQTKTSPWLQ